MKIFVFLIAIFFLIATYATQLMFDKIAQTEVSPSNEPKRQTSGGENFLVANKAFSQDGNADSLVKFAALARNDDSLSSLIVLNSLFTHYSANDLARLIVTSRLRNN